MKTFFVITHVDQPNEDILTAIIDPNEESKPTIYLNLELAEQELEDYKRLGLEYEIRKLSIAVIA